MYPGKVYSMDESDDGAIAYENHPYVEKWIW